MNWLYALLFFLFLFLANERSPIWGEGIVRIKFWIRRIFPNIPTPIHSELKSKLFIFVRILSTTWDAQFQFSYSAHSSTSGFFFKSAIHPHLEPIRCSLFHVFIFHFFIALLLFQLSPQTEWRSTIFKVRMRSTICNFYFPSKPKKWKEGDILQ